MKILLAILLMIPSWGYSKLIHKSPSVARKSFNVIVTNGSKKMWYTVWEDDRGKFYAASSGGKPTIGTLNEQNFQFLNSQYREIASLPMASTAACPKSKVMVVQNKKIIRSACLGARGATPFKINQLAGLLSMLQ